MTGADNTSVILYCYLRTLSVKVSRILYIACLVLRWEVVCAVSVMHWMRFM